MQFHLCLRVNAREFFSFFFVAMNESSVSETEKKKYVLHIKTFHKNNGINNNELPSSIVLLCLGQMLADFFLLLHRLVIFNKINFISALGQILANFSHLLHRRVI